MARYYILCVLIYCANECYGKCSDYYVILQKTDLNSYMPADMNNIDIYSYPYNNSEQFKEIEDNIDCIITKYVTVKECYATEPICKDNTTIKHDKEEITLDTNYIKQVNLSDNNKNNITEDKTLTETKEFNNTFAEEAATDRSTRNDNILTGINETRSDEMGINESSDINANKTEMMLNKNKDDDSKKVAIVVTSVAVITGVLFFVIKKLLDCLHQGTYNLPEPNTSV